MGSEHGQATVEWTGLVLLVAVALGALLALAPSVDGRSLGASVAHAITCAARGGCAEAGRSPAPPRSASGPVGLGVPPAPPARAAPPSPGASPPGTAEKGRAMPGARDAVKRLWLLCLGYRRFRYDLEHPRAPTEEMPLGETLDIANECLNPLGFLIDD